jgi:hypothetical protein
LTVASSSDFLHDAVAMPVAFAQREQNVKHGGAKRHESVWIFQESLHSTFLFYIVVNYIVQRYIWPKSVDVKMKNRIYSDREG